MPHMRPVGLPDVRPSTPQSWTGGPRIPITIRFPPDLYREIARRAHKRGWSFSQFVGWAVANQILVLNQPGSKRGRPGTTKTVHASLPPEFYEDSEDGDG